MSPHFLTIKPLLLVVFLPLVAVSIFLWSAVCDDELMKAMKDRTLFRAPYPRTRTILGPMLGEEQDKGVNLGPWIPILSLFHSRHSNLTIPLKILIRKLPPLPIWNVQKRHRVPQWSPKGNPTRKNRVKSLYGDCIVVSLYLSAILYRRGLTWNMKKRTLRRNMISDRGMKFSGLLESR